MKKLIFALILSSLSLTSFAKTVKENEVNRSQNLVALFNKACMEAFLDEDELSNFLLNNPFEDLNNESNVESKDKKENILDLSSKGKHYSIVNEQKKFFLDISDDSCSVLVKNINHDVFNIQFKEFRKALTTEEFTETAKSFETRKGSTNYKVTAYFYYTQENGEQLPFELFLVQTNVRTSPYQLKLTVHMSQRQEFLNKKSKFVKTINKEDKI